MSTTNILDLNNRLDALEKNSGGGGGTTDYLDLTNKPQINGVTLTGNKATSDFGLVNTFQGTIAEWNQLTTAEKKAYDHASITGTGGGEYNVNRTTGSLEQTAGMPSEYPASQVTYGNQSVEDALDGLTEDSSDTLSDTTYLYANAKIKKKGSVVMIQWNGLKGMTNQTTKTITGLIPQKYRPLEECVFDLCPPSTASVLEIYRIKIMVNGDVTVYPYNGITAQNNLLTTITYLI